MFRAVNSDQDLADEKGLQSMDGMDTQSNPEPSDTDLSKLKRSEAKQKKNREGHKIRYQNFVKAMVKLKKTLKRCGVNKPNLQHHLDIMNATIIKLKEGYVSYGGSPQPSLPDRQQTPAITSNGKGSELSNAGGFDKKIYQQNLRVQKASALSEIETILRERKVNLGLATNQEIIDAARTKLEEVFNIQEQLVDDGEGLQEEDELQAEKKREKLSKAKEKKRKSKGQSRENCRQNLKIAFDKLQETLEHYCGVDKFKLQTKMEKVNAAIIKLKERHPSNDIQMPSLLQGKKMRNSRGRPKLDKTSDSAYHAKNREGMTNLENELKKCGVSPSDMGTDREIVNATIVKLKELFAINTEQKDQQQPLLPSQHLEKMSAPSNKPGARRFSEHDEDWQEEVKVKKRRFEPSDSDLSKPKLSEPKLSKKPSKKSSKKSGARLFSQVESDEDFLLENERQVKRRRLKTITSNDKQAPVVNEELQLAEKRKKDTEKYEFERDEDMQEDVQEPESNLDNKLSMFNINNGQEQLLQQLPDFQPTEKTNAPSKKPRARRFSERGEDLQEEVQVKKRRLEEPMPITVSNDEPTPVVNEELKLAEKKRKKTEKQKKRLKRAIKDLCQTLAQAGLPPEALATKTNIIKVADYNFQQILFANAPSQPSNQELVIPTLLDEPEMQEFDFDMQVNEEPEKTQGELEKKKSSTHLKIAIKSLYQTLVRGELLLEEVPGRRTLALADIVKKANQSLKQFLFPNADMMDSQPTPVVNEELQLAEKKEIKNKLRADCKSASKDLHNTLIQLEVLPKARASYVDIIKVADYNLQQILFANTPSQPSNQELTIPTLPDELDFPLLDMQEFDLFDMQEFQRSELQLSEKTKKRSHRANAIDSLYQTIVRGGLLEAASERLLLTEAGIIKVANQSLQACLQFANELSQQATENQAPISSAPLSPLVVDMMDTQPNLEPSDPDLSDSDVNDMAASLAALSRLAASDLSNDELIAFLRDIDAEGNLFKIDSEDFGELIKVAVESGAHENANIFRSYRLMAATYKQIKTIELQLLRRKGQYQAPDLQSGELDPRVVKRRATINKSTQKNFKEITEAITTLNSILMSCGAQNLNSKLDIVNETIIKLEEHYAFCNGLPKPSLPQYQKRISKKPNSRGNSELAIAKRAGMEQQYYKDRKRAYNAKLCGSINSLKTTLKKWGVSESEMGYKLKILNVAIAKLKDVFDILPSQTSNQELVIPTLPDKLDFQLSDIEEFDLLDMQEFQSFDFLLTQASISSAPHSPIANSVNNESVFLSGLTFPYASPPQEQSFDVDMMDIQLDLEPRDSDPTANLFLDF